ncbi:MAG TPA: aspartate aminotransferase family protein [Dongiaceae bacterium]|jgi:adenosylmethionine-8-amino-7-oxononanoate aminotransferase|nr:aspartate aminotransferase family protein [Dongiaceae bacterium]
MALSLPDLPYIAFGRGCYLFDRDGKRYIDGSGGPAVFAMGHAHPEINMAIREQLHQIAHGYRLLFLSDPWIELAKQLQELTGMPHVTFVSGGSEAVEACLKIALQYQSAIGQPGRHLFIARDRSYHGNTLGALSVSGHSARRMPFESALLPVHFIPAVNAYRSQVPAETLAAHAAHELEEAIRTLSPERVAAFIFEPIVGAAGGCVPAPPGYARRIREICDRYGIIMIADEVMCGAGRTGTWRALEADGVMPDVMSTAKGLAAGYVPLGAALYTERVRAAILSRYETVQSGHTFSAHTLACAAGLAVQRIIKRDHLLAAVREKGERLHTMLLDALADLPSVGDIRGRGLFWGVEFVADRDSKRPFAPEQKFHARLHQAALARGLICYANGGNVDGVSGDHVLLAPPYIANEAELEEIVDKLRGAIQDVEQQLL